MVKRSTKVAMNTQTKVSLSVGLIVCLGLLVFFVNSALQGVANLSETTAVAFDPAPIGSSQYSTWQQLGSVDFYKKWSTQIAPTKSITIAAAQITNGANTHETVQNIMNWMHSSSGGNIQNNNSSNNQCNGAAVWSRNAEQILYSRCAVGCTDWTLVFIAIARAKGISATNLDTVNDRWVAESLASGCLHQPKMGHQLADVYTNLGWELVDPTTGVFTKYSASKADMALMRFDAYTPGRPLDSFGSGRYYKVFRRGLDNSDNSILIDDDWKNKVVAQYSLPNAICGHDSDLYSVANSENCRMNDVLIGTLKYPFTSYSDRLKICKNSSLNIYYKSGKVCNGNDKSAGYYKAPNNSDWSLCYNDSRVDIFSVLDTANCPSNYNQVGVFFGGDGVTKYKTCFRYIGAN